MNAQTMAQLEAEKPQDFRNPTAIEKENSKGIKTMAELEAEKPQDFRNPKE
jgi:hypothetical protein